MKRVFKKTAREAAVLIVITLTLGLIFNFVRKGGIPLIADAEAFRVRTQAEFVKIDDAHVLFEKGRAIFVDAREPESFAIGHIEGAISAPASAGDLGHLAWLTEAGSYIITYASQATQRQAGVIADRLIEMGCAKDSVVVLLEGFDVWAKRGLPAQKGGD